MQRRTTEAATSATATVNGDEESSRMDGLGVPGGQRFVMNLGIANTDGSFTSAPG
jgi:hypothetical protein